MSMRTGLAGLAALALVATTANAGGIDFGAIGEPLHPAAPEGSITCAKWMTLDREWREAFTAGWLLYHLQAHEWATTATASEANKGVELACRINPGIHYMDAYASLREGLQQRHDSGR